MSDLVGNPEDQFSHNKAHFRDEELEIEVDSSEDILEPSVHDKLKLNNPPSVFGSRSYLSDGKAAISLEDLHLESESATYLAQAGKEIHLTRHGIEFTDVKDEEKEKSNNRMDNESIGQENTKHLDQNGGNFYLEMESQAGLENANRDNCDTDKLGCETDGDLNDMHKNSHKLSQDNNDASDKNTALESKLGHNHVVHNSVDSVEPDVYETEKLLEQHRETLTDKEVQEDNLDLSYKEPGSRICQLCRMIGDLSVVKLIR